MTIFDNFQIISDNWKYVLPPSRPSEAELQRIRLLLFDMDRKSTIAILGSTVEYRDLLKEMGFESIYIFDKNRSFYDLSKTWCAYDTSNEILIEGNWLTTLDNYPEHFNVVLSDLTMGNIDYSCRYDFYRSISHMITRNGYFIDKVLTNDMPYIPLSLIRKKYIQIPLNLLTANSFSCEALFCSELLNDGKIDTTKFYDILRSEFSNSPKLLKLIELSHLITPENCVWHYGKGWHKLEKDYISFYIRSSFYMDFLGSPYYGRSRHYFHKKG
ncbi:MAG: hypothetical protein LBU83_08635 [Bacteroidales bacterium]|jgi:hypothetical protein|nr:hypothetical protein [Bacteroidales bacterium]